MPNSLPERVHTDAIALINTVYAFIPQQYHKKIEFSFQIFDNEQLKKKEGWRMGFSTFTLDKNNNLVKVPESKPSPKIKKGNITSHTHLTRNREKETNRPSKEGKTYLKYGYVYMHWKLLIIEDEPRHVWDEERLSTLTQLQVETFAPDRGKAVITPTIMQPVYVGESGAPGKSDFFERSTRIRTANYVSDKLNWIDEVRGGFVIWIINGLPTEWRLSLETHLIEICGRADLNKGPLVNRTDGGQDNRGRLQGHPHSEETRRKQSVAASNREANIDEETKANRSAKISETRTGVKLTEEHKAAISQSRLGKPKQRIRCEHCNESVAPTPFSRYHGDNCIARPGFSDTHDEKGNLLTWSEVNKEKQKAINQELNTAREKSRQVVADWVLKECAGKSTHQKFNEYQFWKEVKTEPKPKSRWYSLSFTRAGKWYSVDETKARNAMVAAKEKRDETT